MNKPDYLYMIEELEMSLGQLKILEGNCINGLEDIRKLQKEVKVFASDVESTLDYLAYFLYEKIYLPKFVSDGLSDEKIESKNRNVSFPFVKYSNKFEKDLNKRFPNITIDYPELSQLFRDVQPMNYSPLMKSWFYIANQLGNESKHRKLTLIDDRKDAFIENIELPNNNIFKNNTFINVKNPIVINGVPLTEHSAESLGGKNFRGVITAYYIIENYHLKLIETLEWIFVNLTKLVNDIHGEFVKLDIS